MYEEEKRLCYVAMTRAKSELVMSWRKEVPIFTADGIRTMLKKRSRFLDVLTSKKGETANAGGMPSHGSSKSQTKIGQVNKRFRPAGAPPLARSLHNGIPDLTLKASKLVGTSGVYETRRPSTLFDTSIEITRHAQPKKKVSQRSSSNGIVSQSRESRKPTSLNQTVARPRAPLARPARPKTMDSTWFFPVGSRVQHRNLGEGIVLPAPTQKASDEMAVLVEFRNGETREFPAQGTDLSIVVR